MDEKELPILSVVMPCYNEQEVLPKTAEVIQNKLQVLIGRGKIKKESFVLLVDDGSHDETWNLIRKLNQENKFFRGIKLAHNSGHQNALLAGLLYAKDHSDCTISIDADLQDDISVIDEFIDRYHDGADIVYGVRKERKTDSVFKRSTAHFFYKLLKVLGVDIIYNHADYRLASKRVLDCLEEFGEINLFLRGIFPLIGFHSEIVYYNRNERAAGESKYPFKKMVSFALDGITSFSIKPLRLITSVGFIIFVLAFICSIWAIAEYFTNHTLHGWVSTVLPIYFIGGIQLLSLGIIGEYIGKIYRETKKRPRFIIEQQL